MDTTFVMCLYYCRELTICTDKALVNGHDVCNVFILLQGADHICTDKALVNGHDVCNVFILLQGADHMY